MHLEEINEEQFDTIYPLFEDNFPKEERKSYQGLKDLHKRSDYHVLADGNKMMAAYYEADDFIMVAHLSIRKDLQSHGYGSKILAYLQEKIGKMIVVEVEHPVDALTKRRVAFYKRNGFYFNDQYDYQLPPMEEGYPFVPLVLMTTKQPLDDEMYDRMVKIMYEQMYEYNGEKQ